MKKPKKPGPESDAALIAAMERAAAQASRIQESLSLVLKQNDERMTANEPIPLSWLTREKNLLAHMRSAAIWNEADGGEEGEAPR